MQNQNVELKNFKNKKVGILGLGDENLALTKFLVRYGADVVICDQKPKEELGEYYRKVKDLPVQFRLGPHYLDHLKDFGIVFRSPGLPYLNPKIQEAKKAGMEVSSQTKLFFDLCPCPIIGVTGTKGKGTTTALIGEILKADKKKMVFVGGNIGTPPIEFLEKLKREDIVVLELSSFQLQDLDKSPHIAVILDIKIDHLDYHKNEQEYVEAKRNIVRFQTKNDFAVINADYLTSFEFAALTPAEIYWFSRRKSIDQGTWIRDDKIFLRDDEKDIPIVKTREVTLRGKHNLENICAAVTSSYIAGAKIESIIETVKSFKGLEHRLEFVKNINGVSFYNDSFSTTPETTIAAIQAFSEPIILLLGGSEKNADYSELGNLISQSSVKAIINIGQTGQKIIEKTANPRIKKISEIQSMSKAVSLAREISRSGDVVLLSPASASFDAFKNYKERGDIFKKIVLSK